MQTQLAGQLRHRDVKEKKQSAVSRESAIMNVSVGGVSNSQGCLLAKLLLMIVIQSWAGANKLTIGARHTPGTVGGCCGVLC